MKARFDPLSIGFPVIIFMLLMACHSPKEKISGKVSEKISGEYFGQTPPGDSAVLFAPGIMSTGLNELNAVFFPGGKEVIFSVTMVPSHPWEWRLVMLKEVNGEWTDPEIAAFSKDYSGVDPFVSSDGNRIYYCSNRPLSGKGEPEDNFDIWYVDRVEGGWSEPVNMGAPINSSANDFYPSLSNDGTLYLQSRREGGFGEGDIYCFSLSNGQYIEAGHLPAPINSPGSEGDVLIAPDESYMIISTRRDEDNYGMADLMISFKQEDGLWSELINMGSKINSKGGENCPMLSPCGKYLFFTSRRAAKVDTANITYKSIRRAFTEPQNVGWFGDIYWVDAGVIQRLNTEWQAH